jgi:hypothetical protein
MQTDAREHLRFRVEQIKKNERLKYLTKISWAHQPSDRAVAASTRAVNDLAWALSGGAQRAGLTHVEAPLAAARRRC